MPQRRRRGKQGSSAGRQTPTTTTTTPSETGTTTVVDTPSVVDVDGEDEITDTTTTTAAAASGTMKRTTTTTTTNTTSTRASSSSTSSIGNPTTTATATSAGEGNNGKNDESQSSSAATITAVVTTTPSNATTTTQQQEQEQPPPLVLTSEKRRGIYECDYCHSDISQQPRIRCAVCPDFDLCLDCFTTTDHGAATARMKAHTHTQNELQKDGVAVSSSSIFDDGKKNGPVLDSSSPSLLSTSAAGSASAIIQHDDTHGYRVCDSTRYPVCPSGRQQQHQTLNGRTVFRRSDTFGSINSTISMKRSKSSLSVAASNNNGDDDNDNNNNDNDDDDDNNNNNNDNNDGDQKMTSVEEEEDYNPDRSGGGGPPDDDDDRKTKHDESRTESPTPSGSATTTTTTIPLVSEMVLPDDPKLYWTAEEDLRLIDAIKTHGLGNWVDVSEAIGGNGSLGKTPKRCMERYFDDFCGRYGHILPPLTIVDDDQAVQIVAAAATAARADPDATAKERDKSKEESQNAIDDTNNSSSEDNGGGRGGDGQQPSDDGDNPDPFEMNETTNTTPDEEETVRSSKRRYISSLSSSFMVPTPPAPGRSSSSMLLSRKKLKVVPTESLVQYDQIWPNPYLPPTPQAKMGQEVARDLSCKAEAAFFKAIMGAPTKDEADKIRQQWVHKIGNNTDGTAPPGAPTVLPPRPDDSFHLPGSELAGFMPRRGDFDIEWENDAETALADMEFLRSDTASDKQLKLQVLEIYVQKLDAREKRKAFVLNRHLYDYRQYVHDEQRLPVDERDLLHRMRLFERFHTPEEHKTFIADILHAKRLRKEIAKLQMYRRIGIRSLAEAEKYELDKNRYQFHKMAQLQRDAEARRKSGTGSGNNNKTGGNSSLARKGSGGVDATKKTTAGWATTSSEATTTTSASGSVSLVQHQLLSSQKVPVDSLWKQYKTNDRTSRRRSTRSVPDGGGGGKEPPQDGDKNNNNNSGDGKDTSNNVDSDDGQAAVAMETDDPVVSTAADGGGNNDKPAVLAEMELDGTPEDVDATTKIDSNGGEGEEKEEKQEDGNPGTSATGSALGVVAKEGDSQAVSVGQEKKQDDDDEEDDDYFDISNSRGIDLLSKSERGLCERLKIYPIQYLEIKKVLIHESLINGLLDKESSKPRRRTIVKIDVEKRGNVIDFLVRAGWISRKLGNAAVGIAQE